MRRRKLTDVLEKGGVPIIERAAFKVVIHRAMVRRRSDTGREEPLDLRGKGELLAVPMIVEGLFPETVPCADQATPVSVPQREREHPVEAPDTVLTPLPVRRQQDFGIRA